MNRAKPAVILVAVSLIVLALLAGRSLLEVDPESESGLAWEGAAPDVEEIFASKRSATSGSGNATRHSSASSHRASDLAEGELVRAVSALDQAHARLAATLIAVSQAEAAFEQVERRIAALQAQGEGSDALTEDGEERLALVLDARERAGIEREKAHREKEMQQVNMRSAEERVEAAELQLQPSLSRK